MLTFPTKRQGGREEKSQGVKILAEWTCPNRSSCYSYKEWSQPWIHSPPGIKSLHYAWSSASVQDQCCCPAPDSLPEPGKWLSSGTDLSHLFFLPTGNLHVRHFSRPETHILHLEIIFRFQQDPSLETSLFTKRVQGPCMGVSWSHSFPIQNVLWRLPNPWPTATLCTNAVSYPEFSILILFP